MGIAWRQIHFAFQPVFNLHTGEVVGVEALAEPASGTVRELLDHAQRRGRLIQTDVALAARALAAAAGEEPGQTVHLNLTAVTAAAPPSALDPVHDALASSRRAPEELVLEVGPPFHGIAPEALLAGLADLASRGYRLALDGLNAGDVPINVLAQSQVDMVKLDDATLWEVGEDSAGTALAEALVHFADRTGRQVVVTGIEHTDRLEALPSLGIHLAQGGLLSSRPALARRGPATGGARRPRPGERVGRRVQDFVRRARTLPAEATCAEVRAALVEYDTAGAIVGVDEQGRPQWSIDRSRFLLNVTGPFGHALHAHRRAAPLADPPCVVEHTADAEHVAELVARADSGPLGNEVVVVDDAGRCRGIVLVHELMRALTEIRVEEAAALNPVTRLPGSEIVAHDVDRRIGDGRPFVVGWIDIDAFKYVNDTAGVVAGDRLIRALGHTLGELAAVLPGLVVAHVGGDDFLVVSEIDGMNAVADRLLQQYPVGPMSVSLSLATLTCTGPPVGSFHDIARILAPLKQHAKSIAGSSWVNGRTGRTEVEVLFPSAPPMRPGPIGTGAAVRR